MYNEHLSLLSLSGNEICQTHDPFFNHVGSSSVFHSILLLISFWTLWNGTPSNVEDNNDHHDVAQSVFLVDPCLFLRVDQFNEKYQAYEKKLQVN